ncbi:MAG: hypothetical protein ACK56I_29545, partial [bacterium]
MIDRVDVVARLFGERQHLILLALAVRRYDRLKQQGHSIPLRRGLADVNRHIEGSVGAGGSRRPR